MDGLDKIMKALTDGRASMKVENNTYVRFQNSAPFAERPRPEYVVRFHDTDIITYRLQDGVWQMKLDNGGFETKVTMNRLNEYLPEGFCVVGSIRSGWNGKAPKNFRPWELITPEDVHVPFDLHGMVIIDINIAGSPI